MWKLFSRFPLFRIIALASLLSLLASCNPKVRRVLEMEYPPLPYETEIVVYNTLETAPTDAEILGLVQVTDGGASINCGYEAVMDIILEEARFAGANAVKITQHTPPSIWGSNCHQITARLLRVQPGKPYVVNRGETGTGYAELYIYRLNKSILTYNLYLDDSLLCRIGHPFRTIIQIRKEGKYTLNATAESKAEFEITLEKGKTYYIRTGIRAGAFAGTPTIELVDNITGRTEFNSIDSSYHTSSISKAQLEKVGKVKNFRLELNGGYSYMIGKVDKNLPVFIQDYAKDLKSAYHYGGGIYYYFRETLGMGLRYDHFSSSNRLDNISLTDVNGVVRTGTMSDNITAIFYGLTVSSRYRSVFKNDQIYIHGSLGYMDYRNDFILIDPYTISGGNIAMALDIGYDFEINKNLYFGVQASYFRGVLTSYYYNDGQSNVRVQLQREYYISLSRINLSGGLRLIF